MPSMPKHSARYLSERKTVAAILDGGDVHDQIDMIHRYDMTGPEYERLADSKFAAARENLARYETTPNVLLKLTADKNSKVKATALANESIDFSVLKKCVMRETFKPSYARIFASNALFGTDLDLFVHTWNTYPNSHFELLYALNRTALIDGDKSPHMHDPRILAFIEPLIPHEDKKARAEYASSVAYANPAVLDQLKEDRFREVINNVACNGRAWPSTHEFLVDHHKTTWIRQWIATVSRDNNLLNKIHKGTTSVDIRGAVERNTYFFPL